MNFAGMLVAVYLRRIVTGFLVAVLGMFGAGTAAATTVSGADVEVGLDAVPTVLIPGARYTVSVANNGPEPLLGTTVVLRLDPRVLGTPSSTPCPYDAESVTLTCSFGALAVGASAAVTPFVYYHRPPARPHRRAHHGHAGDEHPRGPQLRERLRHRRLLVLRRSAGISTGRLPATPVVLNRRSRKGGQPHCFARR